MDTSKEKPKKSWFSNITSKFKKTQVKDDQQNRATTSKSGSSNNVNEKTDRRDRIGPTKDVQLSGGQHHTTQPGSSSDVTAASTNSGDQRKDGRDGRDPTKDALLSAGQHHTTQPGSSSDVTSASNNSGDQSKDESGGRDPARDSQLRGGQPDTTQPSSKVTTASPNTGEESKDGRAEKKKNTKNNSKISQTLTSELTTASTNSADESKDGRHKKDPTMDVQLSGVQSDTIQQGSSSKVASASPNSGDDSKHRRDGEDPARDSLLNGGQPDTTQQGSSSDVTSARANSSGKSKDGRAETKKKTKNKSKKKSQTPTSEVTTASPNSADDSKNKRDGNNNARDALLSGGQPGTTQPRSSSDVTSASPNSAYDGRDGEHPARDAPIGQHNSTQSDVTLTSPNSGDQSKDESDGRDPARDAQLSGGQHDTTQPGSSSEVTLASAKSGDESNDERHANVPASDGQLSGGQHDTTQPGSLSEITSASPNSGDESKDGKDGKYPTRDALSADLHDTTKTESPSEGTSAKPSSHDDTIIQSSPTTVSPAATQIPSQPQDKPNRKKSCFRALVLSWEDSPDTFNMIVHLTKDSKMDNCAYVTLSSPRNKEWISQVDKSSIVIFYSSPSSPRPLYRLERYLEYCLTRKGQEKVIVVIGDADKLQPEWRAELDKNRYCKNLEQFLMSREELDWIQEAETKERMDRLDYALTGHLPGFQGDQVGNGELKENKKQKHKNKLIEKTMNVGNLRLVVRHTVGFVTWSAERRGEWLRTVLKLQYLLDVRFIDATKSDAARVSAEISGLPSLIVFLTKESLASLPDVSFLAHYVNPRPNSWPAAAAGKNKIVAVIEDLDIGSTKTVELFHESPIKKMAKDFFIFHKEETERGDQQVKDRIKGKWKQLEAVINERIILPDPPRKLGTVTIFSRSSKSDYAWLPRILRSERFQCPVDDVRSHYISNSGYTEFYEEVNKCPFGILYHTKNRGRINITDVTDSLYDFEIDYMSTVIGRRNVLVIIDDLEDDSLEEQRRILSSQPKIRKYARNLVLVTEKEKKDEEKLLKKLREALLSPMLGETEEEEKEEEVMPPPPAPRQIFDSQRRSTKL